VLAVFTESRLWLTKAIIDYRVDKKDAVLVCSIGIFVHLYNRSVESSDDKINEAVMVLD
jgi:hypothetical protein